MHFVRIFNRFIWPQHLGLHKLATCIFSLIFYQFTQISSASQVESSPGPSLPSTAAQLACTIASDANQTTPFVTIYINQSLPCGHFSTSENASALNSFFILCPSFGHLNGDGILGNQAFRPNVTLASRIQTGKGSAAPVFYEGHVQLSNDAINKRINSIVATDNRNCKRSLPTS